MVVAIPGGGRMGKATLVRGAVLALLAAGFVLGLVFFPDLKDWLTDLLDAVRELGDWGLLAVVGIYFVGAVVLFPGSVIALGAGFVYGLGKGFLAVSAGSLLGATAGFFLGRTLARGWVEKKVAASPRFRALDQAVGREGFKIV